MRDILVPGHQVIHLPMPSQMILIAAEKEACTAVFDSLDPYCEQCFVDLSRGPFLLLTDFGVDVAEIDKTPERLFSFLDMYETALDLLNTVSRAPSSSCSHASHPAPGVVVGISSACRTGQWGRARFS